MDDDIVDRIARGDLTITGRKPSAPAMQFIPIHDKPAISMLCEDEGCPHHGTPHVCNETPWPANLTMARTDEEFDAHCPVGDSLHPDDNKEPARNMHCTCWYDGDGCCRCKAPAMTTEQRIAQGMEE